MRRLLLTTIGLLIPLAAAAQQPPAVFLMPANLLASIRQYLGARPHDEVASMIASMEACAALQMPDARESTGTCRAVADALHKSTP